MINVSESVLISWDFYFLYKHKTGRMIHMTYDQAIESLIPAIEDGSEEPFFIFRDSVGDWYAVSSRDKKNNPVRLEDIKDHDPLALEYIGKDFYNSDFSYVYDKVLCDRLRAELGLYTGHNIRIRNFIDLDARDAIALLNLFEDNVSEFSNYVMDHLTSVRKPLVELAELCPYKLYTYDTDHGYNQRLAQKAIDRIEFNVYKQNYLNKERTEMIKPVQPVIKLSLSEKLNKAKEKAEIAAESKPDYNMGVKTQNRTEVR